jgi:hypothetical protein
MMFDLLYCDTFWIALTAIFTAVTGLGVLVVQHQLRFDAWIKAQEIFTEKEFVEARMQVFPCFENPTLTYNEENAYVVCRRMDELAHLARFIAFRGKSKILKVWGGPIAIAWLTLEPFVKKEREKTGGQAKWEAFERLGKKAVKDKRYLKGKHRAKVQ